MNNDKAQAALATLCRYVNEECKKEVLDRLRKRRHAATQRAHIVRRKREAIQLEVAFLCVLSKLLLHKLTGHELPAASVGLH